MHALGVPGSRAAACSLVPTALRLRAGCAAAGRGTYPGCSTFLPRLLPSRLCSHIGQHTNCQPFHSCMQRLGQRCSLAPTGLPAGALSHPQLLMPRQQAGLHHRRVLSNALGGNNAKLSTCSSSCTGHGHDHTHDQHHQHGSSSSSSSSRRRHSASQSAHAAAGNAAFDFQQNDVGSQQQQQQQREEQACGGECGGGQGHKHHHHHHHGHHHHAHGHAHSHAHGHHGHHHHHGHGHGHHHHHHFHTDSGSISSNPLLSALSKTGLFSAAEHLEHSTAATVTSISCFLAALLLPYAAAQALIPAATAALLAKAALSVTYVLSGLPQLAETLYAAVAGKIDTHVLMSLSVIGTLYMGLATEGALLLLLFRGSHQLEHRLTEKAAGGLQRLFDSVPDRAVVVEVEEGSNAPRVATSQEVAASDVSIGQHVLVRPGEQVPLDGIITWGTANLSLQHISGEAQPVKLGPGQEVPAGSLSTDGLLVVRVIAAAENSTPARIAQLAAEAQATRPQLTRWLDSVGSVWSKAVIGATLLTAAVLPLLGVPFLGDRGALYRAMGVLTAGSPCALALVPLAYACAIAAITARGILVKSGSAIDALAACKTVALDKTGTITTGSLNLAEGFVLSSSSSAAAAAGLSPTPFGTSSSGQGDGAPVHVRAMQGLAELCRKVVEGGSSSNSTGGALGTTTAFGSSSGRVLDSDDYTSSLTSSLDDDVAADDDAAAAAAGFGGGVPSFDAAAIKCAVALSRLSNHPVSRAMVDSAPHMDGDVSVLSFEQVPGAGVQGVCSVGYASPVHVMFGGADWISSHLTDASLTASLNNLLRQHHDRPSRATAVLAISQLLPPPGTAAGAGGTQAAAADAALFSSRWDAPPAADAAVLLDSGGGDVSSTSSSSSRSATPARRAGSGGSGSRPASPVHLKSSHANKDGSLSFSFEEYSALRGVVVDDAAAAAAGQPGTLLSRHSRTSSGVGTEASAAPNAADLASSSSSSSGGSIAGSSSSRFSSSSGFSVDSELARQQEKQQAALEAYGSPGQPRQLALLCFEDVIQAGVPAAVQQLQSGSWSTGSGGLWGRSAADAPKDVVMLTGDNKGVAEAVARAVGIREFKAGLKPEDKLSYVRAAAAEAEAALAAERAGKKGRTAGAAAAEGRQQEVSMQSARAAAGGVPPKGLLMAGDGINDAPALAAAQVGVAIASTPKDMVAAAADIIVLNGQGIKNLPWLFHVADRTHAILKQNLALAMVSVVFATVPTVAGFFPLWLAVTLHEGSTLLVALNSLRLLLESSGKQSGGPVAPPPPKQPTDAAAEGVQPSGAALKLAAQQV